MFRKLGIGFAALAMLAPSLALALGVGEYQLESYLNQPFKMEVELLDTGDLTEDEILASLAAQEDFSAAGVERIYFLTDLNFAVSLDNNGGGTLTVTSVQPVREPFLNFLVEFLWPTGRLLREYTVLLDPPAYQSDEPASPAAAPAVQQAAPVAAAPAQSQPQTTAPSVSAQPRIVSQSQSAPVAAVDRQQYVVQDDDTMWRIALNNRPAQSISVQQMLVAIQTLNEGAFIDGNVNLVREGTVLRLPTEEEVRRISTREALTEIADQNREWRAKLEARGIAVPTRPQLDATRRSVDRSDRVESAPQAGKVTLVAPDAKDSSDSAAGSAAGTGDATADGRALENELAIRDENVDQLKRENGELSSRLGDLTQQVQTSEQLLQLRNDQIAQLQEQLRKLREDKGVAPVDPIEVEAVTATPGVEPVTTESVVAESTQTEVVAEEESVEPGAGQEGAAEGELASEETGDVTESLEESLEAGVSEPTGVAESEPVVEPEVAPVAEPAVVSEPVVEPQPEPQQQPSFLEQNLILIVAIGAAILVLLFGGLFLASRRRAGQAEDLDGDEEYDEYGDADDFIALSDDADSDDVDDLDSLDIDEEQVPASVAQDPLEEVEVYTAYGRHAEAVTFLKDEISKAPSRSDLKVRLLEVLVETRNVEGFENEASAFAGDADVAARLPDLRGQLGVSEQEPSLDDLEVDLAEEFSNRSKAPADDAPIEYVPPTVGEESENEDADETLVLDSLDEDTFDLAESDELSLDDSDEEEISFELDDEVSEGVQEEDPAQQAELDAALNVAPSLDLSGTSGGLEEEVDFGDIELNDASLEFEEVSEPPAAEELDLSLDDLGLDGDDELSLDSDDLDLGLGESDELSLDGLDEDDLSLSLDDDAATAVGMPAIEDEEPAATVQREALDDIAATDVRAAVDTQDEELSLGDDDDFDFLGDSDENATKLDLAKAYIDMGDAEGARDILGEVLAEGSAEQQAEAKELIAQVG